MTDELKKERSGALLSRMAGEVTRLEQRDALSLARTCFEWAQADADEVVAAMGDDDVLVERLLAGAHDRLGAVRWSELLVASLSTEALKAHADAVATLLARRQVAQGRRAERATSVPEQGQGNPRCATRGHLGDKGDRCGRSGCGAFVGA